MGRSVVLLAVLLVSSSVMAIEIPRYDIEKYCDQSATPVGGTPETCVASERQLQSEVEEEWSMYKAEFLEKCIRDPQVQIYSDLATCLADQATPADDADMN